MCRKKKIPTAWQAEAVKAFSRIDILVNNAAIFINIQRHPFYEITSDEWDKVSAVNIKGPFLAPRRSFRR